MKEITHSYCGVGEYFLCDAKFKYSLDCSDDDKKVSCEECKKILKEHPKELE